MTRLEHRLLGTGVDFPENIERLRTEIPELAPLPPVVVDRLYSEWSEDTHCAGWLIMDDWAVATFRDWLRAEVDEKTGRGRILGSGR